MAKWWARAKTCSASLASKACTFTLCTFGVAARCAVTLHFASAVALVATRAVACHPLAKTLTHKLPWVTRRIAAREDELQSALVLPWVLLSAAGALLWTACAILSLGRLVCRHACRQICKPCAGSCAGPCRRCTRSQHKSKTAEHKEEKDNGPPKIVSSAKVPTTTGQYLRRRTYPKII